MSYMNNKVNRNACAMPSVGGSGMFPAAGIFPTTNQMPTGTPTGPATSPLPFPAGQIGQQFPMAQPLLMTQPPLIGQPSPQTVESTAYLPGFLRTQIGRRMRIEFLIGTTGPLVDRTGTLLAVGASYILIQPSDSDDLLTCDMYSIKFVTILL